MNLLAQPHAKILNKLILIVALALAACAHTLLTNAPSAQLTFQNGQQATVRLDAGDPALQKAFLQWAGQGVYAQAPVYRQLPGIFVLAGKPRLAGHAFVSGQSPTPLLKNAKPEEASTGQIGLVTHADGTVGPEIILIYGHALRTCCQAPANILIGTITSGESSLHTVLRGDNLVNITAK